jgi:hypothetical protein
VGSEHRTVGWGTMGAMSAARPAALIALAAALAGAGCSQPLGPARTDEDDELRM